MRCVPTVLLFGILLIGSTANCGGGSGAGSGPVAQSKATAVEGCVGEGSPIVVVDDPENLPGGYAPVEGARVDVVNILDEVVATTATAADGTFRIEGLPKGYLVVEVRADPISTDPDERVPFTSIPETTVVLGRSFPVSRAQAEAIVLGQASATDRVFAALQPLPPNTDVRPGPEELVIRTTADKWFFFVDLQPEAGFAHAVKYAFIDAQSGEIRWFEDIHWPPIINGRVFWYADTSYLAFQPSDYLDLDPEDVSVLPCEEVVQMGEYPPPPGLTKPTAPPWTRDVGQYLHNTEPDSIFVLYVQGRAGSEAQRTGNDMRSWFKDAKVPSGNLVSAFTYGYDDFDDLIRRRLEALNSMMMDRLQESPPRHSTLVVVIHTHGDENGLLWARTKRDTLGLLTETHFRSDGGNLPSVDGRLNEGPACRIVVVCNTCHATLFTSRLQALFRPSPQDRADVTLYAACAAKEATYSTTHERAAWDRAHGIGYPPANPRSNVGAWFLTWFRSVSTIANGTIQGPTPDPSDGTFPEYTTMFVDYDLTPSVKHLAGDPAWCSLEEHASIGTSPDAYAFSHQVGVTACPQSIGSLVLTNESSTQSITVGVASGHSAISASPSTLTLGPSATTEVSVAFDCSTTSSFSTTLTVNATGDDDGSMDAVTVPVQATIN